MKDPCRSTYLAALCLITLVIVNDSVSTAQTNSTSDQVEFGTGRPLAELVRHLAAKTGLVITYEDPKWQHPSVLEDITDQFPSAKARLAAGEPNSRILVPKSEKLVFSTEALGSASNDRESVLGLLHLAIEKAASGSSPSYFEVRSEDSAIHVIPTIARDSSGELVEHESPLDTKLVLPPAQLLVREALRTITNQINVASPTPILFGNVLALPLDKTIDLEAHSEPARSVLLRILSDVSEPAAWRLLYDPTTESYFFNASPVIHEPPSSDS